MKVVCEKHDGIGIVKASGQLTAASTDAFHEQVSSWQEVEGEVVSFVLDMSDVDFIDSAGLGALIVTLKRATERGGDMKISNLQKKPRMVFQITRAHKIFEIYDTVNEAIHSYNA
ncbi:STAS domain-containing protein [Verrucomicrobiota bacterium]